MSNYIMRYIMNMDMTDEERYAMQHMLDLKDESLKEKIAVTCIDLYDEVSEEMNEVDPVFRAEWESTRVVLEFIWKYLGYEAAQMDEDEDDSDLDDFIVSDSDSESDDETMEIKAVKQ